MTIEPISLVGLIAVAGWFVRRSRTAEGIHPLFWAGLVLALAATQGPIAAHRDSSFLAFALQYLLLCGLAPLLIDVGGFYKLLPQVPPLVSWVLYVATMVGTFFSSVHTAPGWVAGVFHLWLLAVGILFFAPLLRPGTLPHGVRLIYAAMTLPPDAFVSLALLLEKSRFTDQDAGTIVMWIVSDIVAIAFVGLAAYQWSKDDDRVSFSEDLAIDLTDLERR